MYGITHYKVNLHAIHRRKKIIPMDSSRETICSTIQTSSTQTLTNLDLQEFFFMKKIYKNVLIDKRGKKWTPYLTWS